MAAVREGVGACVVLLLLAAGCGSPTIDTNAKPVASPYTGPMTLPRSFADEATVLERGGAAARALECSGKPFEGGGGSYDGGLESAQDTAAEALENFLEKEGWKDYLPNSNYHVEREDDDRILLSWDVDERTKLAFIAWDDIHDYEGDTGWGIESWAQCDPAEFPDDVAEDMGYRVWEDADGHRVPVTTVYTYFGSEHCNETATMFLQLGGDDGVQFVRDRTGELADHLRTTYDRHTTLPDDATDTGFRRDDRELWVSQSQDAAYLVGDNRDDVELLPAAREPINCA